MEDMPILRLKAPVRYYSGPPHVTKTALTRQLLGSNDWALLFFFYVICQGF